MQQTSPARVRETFKVCSIIAITVVLVALAVPTAVEAGGGFMKIQDADSTDLAQVDSGKVRIGDGVGDPDSLTVNGTVAATVNGTVAARPQAVSEYRRWIQGSVGGAGSCTTFATAPAGKAIVLQSLAFFVTLSPADGSQFILYGAPYCGDGPAGDGSAEFITPITFEGRGLVDVPLGPGIVSKTSFSIKTLGGAFANVFGVGYLIPAAEAPPSARG